jgi:hypothetical protein
MRDAGAVDQAASLHEYMKGRAEREFAATGVELPSTDAESFLRALARAGLLRIVR